MPKFRMKCTTWQTVSEEIKMAEQVVWLFTTQNLGKAIYTPDHWL